MADPSHLLNVLGALGVGVAGDVEDAVVPATGTSAAVGAAVNVIGGWGAGSTVDALARALGVTHSRAVRIADQLEAEGLLTRERVLADGRAVALVPTAAGRALAQRLQADRAAAVARWLEPLTGTERSQLETLVDRMLAARAGAGLVPAHACRFCDADVCGHPERCPVTTGARRR